MRLLLLFCASELSKSFWYAKTCFQTLIKIHSLKKSQSRQNITKQTENVKSVKNVDFWIIFIEKKFVKVCFHSCCTVLLALWRVFCKSISKSQKKQKLSKLYKYVISVNLLTFRNLFQWKLNFFNRGKPRKTMKIDSNGQTENVNFRNNWRHSSRNLSYFCTFGDKSIESQSWYMPNNLKQH